MRPSRASQEPLMSILQEPPNEALQSFSRGRGEGIQSLPVCSQDLLSDPSERTRTPRRVPRGRLQGGPGGGSEEPHLSPS